MAQPPGGRSPFPAPAVGAPRTTLPPRSMAFAPFGQVDAIRRLPLKNPSVSIGNRTYREIDNGRANVLVPVDTSLLTPAERAAQREGIVRALFMAGHTFGTIGYGVATTAGAPQRTRDAVLLAGGLVDDVATGRASRSGPVRRPRISPHGQVAPPSLARDRVRLGDLNSEGQASSMSATLVKPMLGTGSRANPQIRPPGFVSGEFPYFDARGHLLARQLGGSGDDPRNLVTLSQRGANSPQMSGFENAVAARVRAGEVVEYAVRPLYREGALPPSALLLTAHGSRGGPPAAGLINNPAARRR